MAARRHETSHILLPSISTVLLLASTLPVHSADKSIAKGNQRPLRIGLLARVVLAIVFLVLRASTGMSAFAGIHITYGSIVWTIVIFHGTRVTVVILKTIVLLVLAWGGGYFSKTSHIGVTVNGLYWYFAAAIGFSLYFVLYWSPRLLES